MVKTDQMNTKSTNEFRENCWIHNFSHKNGIYGKSILPTSDSFR